MVPGLGEEHWLEASTQEALTQGNWTAVSGSEYTEEAAMSAAAFATSTYRFRVSQSGKYASIWGALQAA